MFKNSKLDRLNTIYATNIDTFYEEITSNYGCEDKDYELIHKIKHSFFETIF
jgi:hypothetical protein